MKASQAVKIGLLDVGEILKHVLKVSGVSLPALKVFIGTPGARGLPIGVAAFARLKGHSVLESPLHNCLGSRGSRCWRGWSSILNWSSPYTVLRVSLIASSISADRKWSVWL